MGFVREELKTIEDKKKAEKIGFTYITGEPITDLEDWAIDRENNYILVARGGGGLDMPEGYALYLDGIMIHIEGYDKFQGDVYENEVSVFWYIDLIKFVNPVVEERVDKVQLKKILEEAFSAYSYYGLFTKESVKEVTVNINAEV